MPGGLRDDLRLTEMCNLFYNRLLLLEKKEDFDSIMKIAPTIKEIHGIINYWKAFNAHYLTKLGLLPTENSFDSRNYSLSTVNAGGNLGYTLWRIDHTSTEQFEPTEENQKELFKIIANRMYS